MQNMFWDVWHGYVIDIDIDIKGGIYICSLHEISQTCFFGQVFSDTTVFLQLFNRQS